MPLQPGIILLHRYRIEGVLGQGGMGAVYRAFDINLGVPVAVKENLFTSEEYARQFRREATILASLRHPNLPRVTDHFVLEGEGQYLVMDFIQGGDLRERLERDGAVAETEAQPWFLEIADALAYLHSRNPPILHRDIKPGNIKIMPGGRAILVDFGLAKIVEAGGTTTTGAKAMTPGFSPPEQYGTGRTDPRTDVYSLGATLYAVLTATVPEDSLERAMGREKLTPIRRRNPKVNPSLAKVISKALAVDPEDRYQSIAEFAVALGGTTRASQPTVVGDYRHLDRTVVAPGGIRGADTGPQPSEKIRRRRVPGLVLLIITMVLILAGVIFLSPKLRTELAALFPRATNRPPPPMETSTGGTTEAQGSPTNGVVVVPVTTTPTPTVVESPTAETALTIIPTLPAISTPTGGGVGQIALASDRISLNIPDYGRPQIWLFNIDGTVVDQLTNLPDGACQPAWSPDGSMLLFTSPCHRNLEEYPGSSLWLITVDEAGNASDPELIPSAPGGDYDPAWDPDGERIAFTSLRDTRPQIYVMKLDGSELINLNDDLAHNRQPAWSPTGTQLVFTTSRGGVREIWRMPDTGGEEERFSLSGGEEDSHPDWSPDGQFIMFERNIGGIPRLVVARFEDRVSFTICSDTEWAAIPMAEPRWSPDGLWITMESWPDGANHNIAVITSTCTNYKELTTDPGQDFDPAWRPTP